MLGVLVFIHEFGHFVIAKLFRMGVPVFSFGMGPRLFGFELGGTDYRVSALPVGGYVRLAGADPFGEEDPDDYVEPEDNFLHRPVWQRLAVMLAGPVFNLVLPLVLFTIVLMLGEPQADTSVGSVIADSPASEAGFRVADRIQTVDGVAVETWLDVVEHVHGAAGREVAFEVVRGEEQLALTLPADAIVLDEEDRVDMGEIGLWSLRLSTRIGVDDPTSAAGVAGLVTGDKILEVDGVEVEYWHQLQDALVGEVHEVRYGRTEGKQDVERTVTLTRAQPWVPRVGDPLDNPWGLVPATMFVGEVSKDSAAAEAGVQPDDRLLAVDGHPLAEWVTLIHLVEETAEEMERGVEPRELTLTLVRAGEVHHLRFAPRMEREVFNGEVRYRPIMGIGQYPGAYVAGPEVKVYYGLFEAVPRAFEETTFLFTRTMAILGSLFTGEIRPQESLGGPIEIFRMAGEGAKRGIFDYMRLVGTISISLGIINLLPVPVLDGGQILFYSIEGIRGRPLSLAFREKLQMVGVLALVALMLVVAVFDVNRWLSGG